MSFFFPYKLRQAHVVRRETDSLKMKKKVTTWHLVILWNLSHNFGDMRKSHRLKKLMDPSMQEKSVSGCDSSSESQNP